MTACRGLRSVHRQVVIARLSTGRPSIPELLRLNIGALEYWFPACAGITAYSEVAQCSQDDGLQRFAQRPQTSRHRPALDRATQYSRAFAIEHRRSGILVPRMRGDDGLQ